MNHQEFIQAQIRDQIAQEAAAMVAKAAAVGVVITIEQEPRKPLAMGNHESVVSVRDARGANVPAAPVQLFDAETEVLENWRVAMDREDPPQLPNVRFIFNKATGQLKSAQVL